MNENQSKDMADIELDFDFYEKEAWLENEIAADLEQLQLLREDREKIGNPEALGKVVLDEVWKQFGSQIGLDITNETLIQKYDREHPEELGDDGYKNVGQKVMQDKRYKDGVKEMKKKQQAGELKDEYTGKTIKKDEKANLDHTVSRKEISDNPRRKQANIPTEDLANKKENLNPTNESLNKSKGKKSVKEMTETREQREKDLKTQNEKANKKIDDSNMSETEKKKAKEKNNKRLKNKLDADDELMKKKDKEARKAINKDIAKGVVKETGKKAGKDALKAMAVQALFDLLKEVMNALVRFFKSSAKTFKGFLDEMKKALQNFVGKINSFLKTGATTVVGTIVTEIFGPIVSLFKKLASVIKQGIKSLGDAISYLKNKENVDKPFGLKMAEVGKIVVAGLVTVGAIFGGEVFEAILAYYFPILETTKIPLLGSLANIIGMFLASLISGVLGAIIINLIDKLIAKHQKAENSKLQVAKGNEILNKQNELINIKDKKMNVTKQNFAMSMSERNRIAKEFFNSSAESMKNSLERIDNNKSDIDRLLETLQED